MPPSLPLPSTTNDNDNDDNTNANAKSSNKVRALPVLLRARSDTFETSSLPPTGSTPTPTPLQTPAPPSNADHRGLVPPKLRVPTAAVDATAASPKKRKFEPTSPNTVRLLGVPSLDHARYQQEQEEQEYCKQEDGDNHHCRQDGSAYRSVSFGQILWTRGSTGTRTRTSTYWYHLF